MLSKTPSTELFGDDPQNSNQWNQGIINGNNIVVIGNPLQTSLDTKNK